MSSNEEDFNDNDNPQSKKRRVQRACDICRRKKIRCDGGQMPGNQCSNCIAYSFDCTYVEAAKKRGPPKGYVERLESRVEKLEKVLTRLHPGHDILKELDAVVDIDAWLTQKVPLGPLPDSEGSDRPAHAGKRHPRDIATSYIRNVGTPHTDYPQDDDFTHVLLAKKLQQLDLGVDAEAEKKRFHGKSSSAMLVHTAMELKNEYTGGTRPPILGSRREEFWHILPWERPVEQVQKTTCEFPEDDLLLSLVDLFFERTNHFSPLLHRPTFTRSIADGLYLRDDNFAANLLLVCAVASCNSDDPRVLMDGVQSLRSAGWKWFHQVQKLRKSPFMNPPSLYDLQFCCLSVMFLQGSSMPQASWTMIGIGIRLAQDVGAHRRKHSDSMTVEDELWKRAFWVLVTMDRMMSSALGRPCAIQDEDFDVDLPIECDDEYWEHSDPCKRFKQPSDKPSYVTGFVLLIKLNQVLAILLRTIYSINKSKIALGFVGQQWEQHIVAELDSALNKWVDSVPDHLRWDPARENLKFFEQSASLYCTYYYIQILIHRSFIPSPNKPSPLSFPSLAICTNAARSCSHIVAIHYRRGTGFLPQIHHMTTFTAAVVLLLNIWGGRRSGLSTDTSKDMIDVHKSMQALRKCEVRWPSAGRLWDILYELASVGELPLPKPSPPANNKRDRDSDSPSSWTLGTNTPSPGGMEAPRTIAGSRRVNAAGKQPTTTHIESQPQLEPPVPLALPLYSNELGRFPVNPQAQFPSSPQTHGQTGPVQGQSRGMLPTYWDAAELPMGGASAAQFRQPGLLELPFNMHTQMGFGYSNLPFVQSAPAANSLFDGRSVESAGMHSDPRMQTMMAGQGQYASSVNPDMQALIDSETVAMWSNAPSGYELDDWGTYLSSVSELTHGMYHAPIGG